MAFWLVLLQVGATLLSILAKKKPSRPEAQKLEGWFAEDGRPIPYIFGLQPLSPNVVWWGHGKQHDDTNTGTTVYRADLIGTLCMGPVKEIVDVQMGGKSLTLEPLVRGQSATDDATAVVSPALPQTFSGSGPIALEVHARQMFGGDLREGGFEGMIRLYPGLPDQPVDPLSTESLVNDEFPEASCRPGVCHLCIDGIGDSAYWGRLPNPKEIVVVLRTEPHALLDLGLNPAYTSARIGVDSNPGEIIYPLALDPIIGATVAPDGINLQSLADLAATCQAEQFGLSATVSTPEEALKLVQHVLEHIDGVPYKDPATGLLAFKLVRADYELEDLLEINPSNVLPGTMQRSEPGWRKLSNEIRVTYRKWLGGAVGPVTDEPLGTLDLQVDPSIPFYIGYIGTFYRRTRGRNITSLVLKAGATTLVNLTDYTYDPPGGFIHLIPSATVLAAFGETLTASYLSAPAAMHLRESVARDYDSADQQLTREVRLVTIDYPFLSNEVTAQLVAARELKAQSTALDKLTWKMNRAGHALHRGSVVKHTWPAWGWTQVPLRILDVDYGLLEDGPIDITAVQDVWGRPVFPRVPPSPGDTQGEPQPVAPGMAIGCGLGGDVARYALFPSDTTFSIELWGAEDSAGTGAILVATLAGTTTFWDEDGTDAPFYAARLVRAGFAPGAFTPWVHCEPDGGDPEPPACVLLTWVVVRDDAAGTARPVFTDPQNRLQLVQAATQADGEARTDYADLTSPYEASVVLGGEAFIYFRISHLACDGTTSVVDVTVRFSDAPPPEPPTPDALGGVTRVVFHAELWGPLEIPRDSVPGDGEVYELSQIGRRRVDCTGLAWVRILCQVGVAMPFLGEVGFQYVPGDNLTPAEEDWDWLNRTDDGPFLTLTEATVVQIASLPQRLAPGAMQDIHIRAVVRREAGTLTVDPRIDSLELELQGGFSIPQPPEQPEPPTPCNPDFDDFTKYSDTADLETDWSIDLQTGSAAVLSLDIGGGPDGDDALKLTTPPQTFTFHLGPFTKKVWSGHAVDGDTITCTAKYKSNNTSNGLAALGPQNLVLKSGANVNASGDFTNDGAYHTVPTLTVIGNGGGDFEVHFGWGSISFFGAAGWEGWLAQLEVRVNGVLVDCGGSGEDPENPPFPPEDPGGGSDDVPDTPATGSRALILWGYYEPTWGDYPPYQGSVIHRPGPTLISLLTNFRSRGWRFALIPASDRDSKSGSVFSQSSWLSAVRADYTGVDTSTYLDILTIIMVLDEPFRQDRWGINGVPWAVVDGVLAKECKALFPGVPRIVRLDAEDMERTGLRNPQYITGPWNSWLKRKGDPVAYMARAKAATARLGFKNYVWGLNPHPSSGPWMTVDEFRRVGIMMAQDAASLGVSVWDSGTEPSEVRNKSEWAAAAADIIDAMVQP